ncbi:hypothetical protein [Streptomyces sp. NPDC001933]|uniref:hypothetical protein n=1 Tax=Streptomyces sp. NPDC001933 TaxID=3364626 RepID=UPI0036A2E2B4
MELAPGQALFLGAGIAHAYLSGLGVEITASSDNVLRCGLTSKHVDAAELLETIRFTAFPVRAVAARWDAATGGTCTRPLSTTSDSRGSTSYEQTRRSRSRSTRPRSCCVSGVK